MAPQTASTADVKPIDEYRIPVGCCDELVDADGYPLPHGAKLISALEQLGPQRLAAAGMRRDAIFMQQGITFEVPGADGERRDRAWPLDLIPRVITAAEWTTIKRGLAQRIRALNAFVDDVYHAHEIVRAGIVPWSLVVSRPAFARPVHGVRPPGGVYCHVCGCDLVRDGDGRWRVLEDNVRTPSGISYVLENRLAMTRLMPELFAGHRIRGVDHYPSLLLEALCAVAPGAEGLGPTVVLWTPGPMNSAYFEHAFLARQMGIELVEANDLVVRDAVCYMRTTGGLQRVHTIYRRLDDDFVDPLEFRPDSLLGVPGLIRAYRAGTVAIANAIGTGVADDKAIYHYVPEMVRFYLGEEAILENVPTYVLTDELTRKHVLARLHELVVKPTSESGGKGVFIGPQASPAARAHQAELIEAQPERFIAQELVHLSTVPTETGRGRLAPRHVDLRPFAVFGDEIRIVPGGLTRVALEEGSMIVNSSQGGGSKDTWVLDDSAAGDLAPGTLPTQRPPRLPDVRYGGWQGQAQQQQQGLQQQRSFERMLARIAHDLYWLGRDLARAEHTARMLDGAFHADVAGVPDERGISLSWDALLAIIGAKPPAPGEAPLIEDAGHGRSLERGEVARLLTLDVASPASVVSCISRARERARTLRDVVSTEMWESLNSFYLSLSRYDLPAAVRTGPYSLYQEVKERCALFWGLVDRTMLRDDGRAFLEAGGRIESADMVLRMLRVTIPASPVSDGYESEALALLHAAGAAQAYRRAVRDAPTVEPVVRFLLYDSAYPGSVAFSALALREALAIADEQPRSSPPVLRLGRLIADLELQRRTPAFGEPLEAILERVQTELGLVDHDIGDRYFAIAALSAVHL